MPPAVRRVDSAPCRPLSSPTVADREGAGVESALRGCVPIPHRAAHIQAGHRVRYFTAAEDAYQQLIAQHVDYAERALTTHIARQHNGAA